MALGTTYQRLIGEANDRCARRRRTARSPGLGVWLVVCFAAAYPSPSQAVETIYPVAGGTLADGGVFGERDGVVDRSSWEFDSTGISGAVTFATAIPASAVEQRVVCEYDLRGVSLSAPVVATLSFSARAVSVFPFPDVPLQIYSYPADLMESAGDFSAEPVVLHGIAVVPATQTPRRVAVDVSDAVNAALVSGGMIAFRFQIDPNSPHTSNQVFIDALDTDPMTKPTLIIGGAVPGDADSDGDVDLNDFAALTDCLTGPGVPPAPSASAIDTVGCLWLFDYDGDADVDIEDHTAFLGSFGLASMSRNPANRRSISRAKKPRRF